MVLKKWRNIVVAAGIFMIFTLSMVLMPQSAQADETALCNASNIMTYSNRTHVRCTESFSGIQYFAIGHDDSSATARILSILTAGALAGKTLIIGYDASDTSGTSIGCRENDCRLIKSAGFWQ